MMKYLLMVAMLFSANTFASDLNHNQAAALEQELDNICGDTWCEGEFNWRFNDAKCDFSKETCSVELTLEESVFYADEEPARFDALYSAEIQKVPGVSEDEGYYGGPVNIYSKVCTMKGMKSVADVIDSDSYSERTYELVTDCISEMEEEYFKLQDQAFVSSRLRACVPSLAMSNIEVQKKRGEGYSRRFYNEETEYNNLIEYSQRVHSTHRNYESGLRMFITHKEKEAEFCALALSELESEYYVLAFNIGANYQDKKHSVRLTKKRRSRDVDSINFTITR